MSDHTAAIPAPQPAAPRPMFEPAFVKPAIWEAFKRLAPQAQWKNPVMFVCYVGAIITTGLGIQAVVSTGEAPAGYILARLAVALVHGPVRQLRRGDRRGARQGPGGGAAQRAPRHHGEEAARRRGAARPAARVKATELQVGDIVLVEAGDTIPLDGEVIEGVASVNESAITGESAPVIREAGGDFSSVTGGTLVHLGLARRAHHRQARASPSSTA